MSSNRQKQPSSPQLKVSTKKSIDRRVERTRTLLHQALRSLIIEKGYEAISVEDICKHANIGRSTFYAHFTSKDDLKQHHLKHFRGKLLEQFRTNSAPAPVTARPLGFSLPMFEHACHHIHHHRALLGSKEGGIALDMIRQTLCEFVRTELAKAEGTGAVDVPREAVVQHIVGSYMAVLVWWLERGAKLPPQQMDEFFQRTINKGIKLSPI